MQEEVGLQQYFDVLWRRKWAISAVFVIVWCLSLVAIMMSEPKYKAQSLVAVKNQMYWRAPMMSFSQGTDEPDMTLSGEAYQDIINGLPFADRVSDHLTKEGMPMDPAVIHGSVQAAYQEPDRIYITATSTVPDEAVAMANAAAVVFVEYTKSGMMDKLVKGLESATAFQSKSRTEVEKLEEQIAEFKREMGFVDLNGQMEALREKIAGFESARGEVITKLEVAQKHQEELLKLAKVGARGGMGLDDPRLDEYRKLQEAVADARVRYTEDHPALQNLVSQMKAIEDRLAETIARIGGNMSPEAFLTLKEDLVSTEKEISDLTTAIDSWTRQIAEVEVALAVFPDRLARLQSLEGQAQAAQDSYKHWSKNLEELQFKRSMIPGNASLMDVAVQPRPAMSKLTMLILSTMVSLLLAVGSGLLAEFADSTLRTAEETAAIGLNYLGSIVRLKDARPLVFEDGKATHQAAEAYTRVYSNIRFAEVESPLRSFLVTSARKGEGKSTTLVNLACAIAAAGKRVIIVDTDLRNPTLQRHLGLKYQAGLTSVLSGEKALEDVLKPTGHPGLTILPAGPIPPNPAEMIHSHRMRDLVRVLEEQADMVIFDSPPALLVADAMLLCAEIDAAIIVVESGGVSRRAVQQVKESLQMAKARVLGVILNKIQEGPGAYYNYYSYYKAYHEPEEETAAPVAASSWIRGFRKSAGDRRS